MVASLWSCDDEGVIPDPTPLELETPSYFGDFQVPADNTLTNEGVALGRMLFYDKRLSLDNSVSCSSCHDQQLAFTDGLALSVGIAGTPLPVSSMSLANQLWNTRFFWNGRASSLEEQALLPIENPLEMNQSIPATLTKLRAIGDYPPMFQAAFGSQEITADRLAKALAQFQRTLISADSKFDRVLRGEEQFTDQELRGRQLFFTHPDAQAGIRGGNCGDCHSQFLTSGFTTGFDGFHNNGLDSDQNLRPGLEAVTGNPTDRGKFKAPTLRNIELTAPYMHDGRFNTLEEVLDHYNDNIVESSTLDVLIREASNEDIIPNQPIKLHLTQQEKEDIIAFLKTLTDNTFINNEKFSDPF